MSKKLQKLHFRVSPIANMCGGTVGGFHIGIQKLIQLHEIYGMHSSGTLNINYLSGVNEYLPCLGSSVLHLLYEKSVAFLSFLYIVRILIMARKISLTGQTGLQECIYF